MTDDFKALSQPTSEKGQDIYFWPVLILIIAMLTFAIYQVVVMEGQVDSLQQGIRQLEPKVQQAAYQKSKLYQLASDVLQLAPTDPIAKQIVTDYKIEHRAAMPASNSGPSGPPGLPEK